MNDNDIAESIRATLRSHSVDAPNSAGLLERVKVKSRKRTFFGRIGAGASALAVAAVAALLTGQVMQAADGSDASADDEVRVCFDVVDDKLKTLMISGTDHGGSGEAGSIELPGGNSVRVEYPVGDGDYKIALTSWDIPVKELPIEDDRDVTIGGAVGRTGTDAETGERVVGVETGITIGDADITVSATVVEGSPSEAELLAFAESIEFHHDAEPCDMG